LVEGLILQVRAGSRAYGVEHAESDYDSRGICIPAKRFLLGLETFEQLESAGSDHVVYGLPKFVRLALEGNPNLIETLWTEDILFLHPLGQRLIDHRQAFLSKNVAERFGSYALHQLQRLERHHRWLSIKAPPEPSPSDFQALRDPQGQWKFLATEHQKAYREAHRQWQHYQEWRSGRNPARAELEERYGYDTKHAMHLCRLLTMGLEILRLGEVRVRRPDAEWLRSIRSGAWSYTELREWTEQRKSELEMARSESHLPEQPDRNRIEQLQIELLEAYHWPPKG
jgi:predicted nucleotidyltransferase